MVNLHAVLPCYFDVVSIAIFDAVTTTGGCLALSHEEGHLLNFQIHPTLRSPSVTYLMAAGLPNAVASRSSVENDHKCPTQR